MRPRRETLSFGVVLGCCVLAFFHESLVGGKILSPADVLLVEASFQDEGASEYEPHNRLLMDPVLQFQPWLEFNRAMIRQGRMPFWNPYAGCGAPHLANGQSAVFDPFHLIAYLGAVPWALGWMAAGRLWTAGMGSYLLARSWGLGPWGCWFAGLVYPFCGFLVVWLLYPVTPVAIWLPWLILASDRALRAPDAHSAGLVAIITALTVFGGHIQTTAHVLLAAGLFTVWRGATSGWSWRERSRRLLVWGAGIALGLSLAAVQILPLAGYLSRSPVWEDRQRETRAWWSLERPRVLDTVCMALPYAYGSQRRGHPNLARGLGVHNLNESAGGYTGLATLIWLAPLGLRRRAARPETFLIAGLAGFGVLAAFRFPPADNLLRAIPVLNVTDNRRLGLWTAFGITMLGGIGMDALRQGERLWRWWPGAWLLAALILAGIAMSAPWLEPRLQDRAERHYRESPRSASPDLASAQARANRQVRLALRFIPRYYGLCALQLVILAGLAMTARRRPAWGRRLAPAVMGLTLAELACFGVGLNPSIEPAVQEFEPAAITCLRERLGHGERAIGLGEELPPNVLMRFGLADVRNYDSVEMARSLQWLAPVYEPSPEPLSSRRQITWEGILRARDRLAGAGVAAVVGASAPPATGFSRIERAGRVWIAQINAAPWAATRSGSSLTVIHHEPGRLSFHTRLDRDDQLVIRETWDPGWRVHIDGSLGTANAMEATFLSANVPSGSHIIELSYVPNEWLFACFGSLAGALGVILALTGRPRF